MDLERPIAPDPYALLPAVPGLSVTSPAFTDGADLPASADFAQDNISPALSWSGGPSGTASYVVSCYDPDAPTPSGFWHWMIVGIPADVTELVAGAGAEGSTALPAGAVQLHNDFGFAGFGGAAPPPGDRPHRYMFAVHALDTDETGIEADFSPAKASFTFLGHVIGRGTLTGMYSLPADS